MNIFRSIIFLLYINFSEVESKFFMNLHPINIILNKYNITDPNTNKSRLSYKLFDILLLDII